MEYMVGQAVYGAINFVDGSTPEYKRPYLIIKICGDRIGLLNVSSLAGKEWKLAFDSNYELVCFNPPFIKETFVKLDSLQYVPRAEVDNMKLLSNGATLSKNDIDNILFQGKSFFKR